MIANNNKNENNNDISSSNDPAHDNALESYCKYIPGNRRYNATVFKIKIKSEIGSAYDQPDSGSAELYLDAEDF